MLPFGVTIPNTAPQRSEIPEGLMNYPVYLQHQWKVIFGCKMTSLHSSTFKATLNRRHKEVQWRVKTTTLDDFPSPVYPYSCILFKYPPLPPNHKGVRQNILPPAECMRTNTVFDSTARILHGKIANCGARKGEAAGTDMERFDLKDLCMHPL